MGVVRSVLRWVCPVALTAGVLVVPPPPAAGAMATTPTRLAGVDRYDTAAKIAEAKFPNGVPTVVLASGLSFADALAGSYLAGLGAVGGATGPAGILLTDPNSVPSTVTAALSTLKVHNIVILGGESAVSAAVANQLSGAYHVTRIFGTTRYDTMAAIDGVFGAGAVATVGGKKTAFIASGANFPDALAAGGAAYGKHIPIVLTLPDQLSGQAAQTLTALGIQQVLIMGGSSAIHPAVNAAVTGMGITVAQQFAGLDRTDTATQFDDYALANLGFTDNEVVVTRGDSFADALAGAQYMGDPRLLIPFETPVELGDFDAEWLAEHQADIGFLTAMGGPGGLSIAGLASAQAAADGLFIRLPTPDTIPQGRSVTVTVTGGGYTTGLQTYIASEAVGATGNCIDITGTSVAVASPTQYSASFSVPTSCPTGSYSLAVIRNGSTTNTEVFDCAGCLAVTGASSISMAPGVLPNDDSSHAVTITGTDFNAQSTAYISPSINNHTAPSGPCGDSTNTVDIQVSNVNAANTQITGSLTIPTGCQPGAWDVTVDNTAGGGVLDACAACLTVTGSSGPPGPVTITSCSPSQIPVGGDPTPGGQGEEVKIFGTGFDIDRQWRFVDSGGDQFAFVNDQNFPSSTEIDIFISPTTSQIGTWDAQIVDNNNQVVASDPGCLTVVAANSGP